MKFSECPNCERMVIVGKNPRMGQQVVCNSCNTKLEIYLLDPIELDWATSGNHKNRYGRGSSYEEDELDYRYLEER